MLRIGLTGPTGSGKSTVTALMRCWGGIEILDADTIAHEVNNSPACTAAIAAAFPGTRLPDGTIDRKALGAIVFSRPEELSRLVGITFPLILAECEARMDAAEAAGCRACVLDAPTLFESGGDQLCDVIVSVVTPREERLRRVLERDGITREAAEALTVSTSAWMTEEAPCSTMGKPGRRSLTCCRISKRSWGFWPGLNL